MVGRLLSWSIRTHLVILLLLLALPCILVTVYSGVKERNEAMDEAKRECRRFVDTVATEQQSVVAGAQQLAATLALLPEVQSRNVEAVNALFSDLLRTNPQYANISAADKSGIVWASAVSFEAAVSVADRKSFRDAVHTGKFSSGEYGVGKLVKRPIINFGYPVKNRTNELVAVVAVVLNLQYAEHIFEKINRLPGAYFSLLDHQGVIFIRRPEDAVSEKLLEHGDIRKDLFTRMGGGADEGTFESVGNDGKFRLFAYKRIRLSEESKPYLYIRASVPMASVISKANVRMIKSLALLVLVFGLGLFLVGLIAERVIVNPVLLLKKVSEQLGAGTRTVHVSRVVKGGELGQLARAFDGMAETLAQREKALRESEERYRLLIEAANEGIWSMDGDHVTAYVNQAMADMLGYAPSEMLGRKVEDFFFPEDMSFHEGKMRKRHSGEDEVYERRFRRRDGSQLWTLVSAKVREDSQGRFIGSFAMFTDITSRKRAEEELRASEEKYRRLFQDAVLGVFQSTPEGKIVTVNPAFARMFGYASPDELMAMVTDIASDLYADPFRRPSIVRMIEETGGPVQVENRYRRKDGSTFVGNLHAWNARDADGAVVLEEFLEDITERKEAEDALRENREQFKAMFEMASIGMAQADPRTGQFLRVNQKMCQITGYSSDELLTMRVSEITHPEDREQDRESFQDVVDGKSSDYRMENRYIRKDGAVVWVNVNMAVVRSAAGLSLRTVSTIEDITDRRHTEEQIKASLHEKEVLLKEVHHRVKNNLQVISSLLNMQMPYVHDPKDKDVFKASMDRVKSMALIHDKLYRSENLANIYFPGYVDDLVRGLFANYAMDRGVELDLRVDPISLNIDHAIPLGLIINELVSNALKHAFPVGAGGAIRIRLHPQGDRMVLAVSDNGIGFPGDLDFTNTQSLGMQLVVTLVEQLDGTIELKRNKGTEFRIVFEQIG
jgi:PAS domain S-box-containing protein